AGDRQRLPHSPRRHVHDADGVSAATGVDGPVEAPVRRQSPTGREGANGGRALLLGRDRKSTRLNSSHGSSSYAVFCLKKKKRGAAISPRQNSPGRGTSPAGYQAKIGAMSCACTDSIRHGRSGLIYPTCRTRLVRRTAT